MKTFKIKNGDIAISTAGNPVWLTGQDKLVQDIEKILLTELNLDDLKRISSEKNKF